MTSFSINSVHFHRCPPDWSWDSRNKPMADFDLWYVTGGRGRLHAPYGRFGLSRGICFILRPGEGYLGSHEPRDPLSVFAIHFHPLDGDIRKDLFPFSTVLEDPDFFETLCRRLMEKEGEQIWFQSILREYRRNHRRRTRRPTENERRVGTIKDYIRRNISSKISIEALSDTVFLSKNQTMRIFKETTGMTIHSYLKSKRMEKARLLLQNSDLSVKRIGKLCGYGDTAFFCREFRESNSQSPKGFRESGWMDYSTLETESH